jgi:hypothetical protein
MKQAKNHMDTHIENVAHYTITQYPLPDPPLFSKSIWLGVSSETEEAKVGAAMVVKESIASGAKKKMLVRWKRVFRLFVAGRAFAFAFYTFRAFWRVTANTIAR